MSEHRSPDLYIERFANFVIYAFIALSCFVFWRQPVPDMSSVTKTVSHSDGSLFVEQTISGDTHWVGKGMKWKEGKGDKSIALNGITIHPVEFIEQETTAVRGQLTGEQMDKIDQMGHDFQNAIDNAGGLWVNPDYIRWGGGSEGSTHSEPVPNSGMSAEAAGDVPSGHEAQSLHDGG